MTHHAKTENHLLIGLLILVLLCGCSHEAAGDREGPPEVYAITVTAETKDDFLESIAEVRGLSVVEVQLLMGYILSHELGTLTGEQPPLVGMTVGEMIDAHRSRIEQREEEEHEQAELAAEAKAEARAEEQVLREAVNLTVYEKSFSEGDWEDYIRIKCRYENRSDKEIRAFQGVVRFKDIFGDLIYESSLKIADPVAAGAKGSWTGGIEYNQFMDDHKALRNTALEDMKIDWTPLTVIFADGTTLGEQ